MLSLILLNIYLIARPILDLAELIGWHFGLKAKFSLWSLVVMKPFLLVNIYTVLTIPRLLVNCLASLLMLLYVYRDLNGTGFIS